MVAGNSSCNCDNNEEIRNRLKNMKESLKFKKGEGLPEPEGGWKVGMKARLENFATVENGRANKTHRAVPVRLER